MSNRTAWLFPGQGSQEIGMGSALKGVNGYLDSAFDLAEEFSELPLRECVQRGPESTLTSTAYAQPAIIAVSIAYADLLFDHGTRPDAVAGHSLGELGALYAAGVLSAQDTLQLAATRGRLMAASGDGTMVAIKDLAPEQIEQLIASTGSPTLVVANYNTPEQTVVSGDTGSVERLEQLLAEAGHRFVRLNVSGAWHSPLVAEAAEKVRAVMDTVVFHEPQSQVFLGAVGVAVASAAEIREIMNRQIVSPVRWYKTMEAMIASGVDDFTEVGPGKVLRGLMRKAVSMDLKYEFRGVDNKRFVKQVIERKGTTA
jgi:[acyl-carrier-protein] S-malonyltransferase